MATPEQDAFIQEMMHKKPGEVWQELWDARQTLKGVGMPRMVLDDPVKSPELTPYLARTNGYIKPLRLFPKQEPKVFTYPDGTWHPLPVEMYDQAMEYMKTDQGIVYIRAIEPGLTVARSGFADPVVVRGGPKFTKPHYTDAQLSRINSKKES